MQTPTPAAAVPARHTPGPWHWFGRQLVPTHPNPQQHAVHTILERCDGGHGFFGKPIADVLAELQADDALIAEAPNLLAALRALARRYRELVGLEGAWDDALVHAERAISNAEGQS